MSISDATAAKFWDAEIQAATHNSWMAHPAVRAYINESISGSPFTWPMDWLLSRLDGRRFVTALSVGCGTGPLERDLIRRGLCKHVDAFDGSAASIERARELAAADGVADQIHYFLADFNEPRLPDRRYDIVFFHQSAHHVAKLEKIYSAILKSLAPDGLVYLDEYIGPSRSEWSDDLVRGHREIFGEIPREMRLTDEMALPIQPWDPSEAVRSSEIVPQLRHGFRLLEKRGYGGNVLSVIYPSIRWEAAPESLIGDLIEADRAAVANAGEPFHAVILAAPKQGWRKAYARARYFVAPKLRRIRLEVRVRLLRQKDPRF